MKTLILFAFFYIFNYAQSEDSVETSCKVRGHIFDNISSITDARFPAEIIDLEDRTLKITWDRNWMTRRCKRCGAIVTELIQPEPDTVIIWRSK